MGSRGRVVVVVVAVALGALLLSSPAAQANGRKCGTVMGNSFKVKAKRVSCHKAKHVAKQYLRGGFPKGWECRATRNPAKSRCSQGHNGGVVIITETGGGDRATTRAALQRPRRL